MNGVQKYLAWLPIIVVAAALIGSFATQQAQTADLKRRVGNLETQSKDIIDLKVRGARIDERTEQIQRTQKEAKEERRRIEALLRSLEVRTRGLGTSLNRR